MKTLKILIAVLLIAFACLTPYHVNALHSDVGAGTNTWGGAFVWGFESWNTIDLHTGATDIARSKHYMSLTNQWNSSLSYDWKVRFWVASFGHHFEYRDSNNGTLQPGATFDVFRNGSMDVGPLRPGQITLKGYSELNAGGDTWLAEDTYWEYLHDPHH